jgi:membrane associated rhomboid family serine protease
MLFLWIFGDNVEDTLGWLEYLLLYLLSGIVGFLAQSMASPESVIPVLGASGAVAGVMGAYLLLFPLNAIRVLIFYFPADLPAYVVIGLWIVSQFVLGVLELDRLGKTGGVAYLAHIGGVAMGMLATYLLVPERESSVGS